MHPCPLPPALRTLGELRSPAPNPALQTHHRSPDCQCRLRPHWPFSPAPASTPGWPHRRASRVSHWARGKLAFARGGGGCSSPPKGGGGGSRKGALVTGQSPEASLKPLMMTDRVRRKAARTIFFQKNFPHDTDLKMISASWGIMLSHFCCGTSGPPPPPQTSPVSPLGVTASPSGVPVTGAQKGGGSRKGARTTLPPPPAQANFPPALCIACRCATPAPKTPLGTDGSCIASLHEAVCVCGCDPTTTSPRKAPSAAFCHHDELLHLTRIVPRASCCLFCRVDRVWVRARACVYATVVVQRGRHCRRG